MKRKKKRNYWALENIITVTVFENMVAKTFKFMLKQK